MRSLLLRIVRIGIDNLRASRDLATDLLNSPFGGILISQNLHWLNSLNIQYWFNLPKSPLVQFSHLQRLLRLETLLISCEIPQGRRSKSSVRLLEMGFLFLFTLCILLGIRTLIPASSFTRLDISTMSVSTAWEASLTRILFYIFFQQCTTMRTFSAFVYWPWP